MVSRVISKVEGSTRNYYVHTPLEIQVEIDPAEVDVRVLKHFLSDEEVPKKFNLRFQILAPRKKGNPNIYELLTSIGT
jgi:DNA polymerase II large subunit